MYRTKTTCLLILSSALLLAGGPAWQTKPISQWNEMDAKQVLRSSPWVKHAPVSLLFQPSEDQLRAGGNMGGGKGVGLESLAVTNLVGGGPQHSNSVTKKPGYLVLRWESASPVRKAEAKLEDSSAPGWDGEYYAVAVYGVPVDAGRLDEPGRAGVIKRLGILKRDGMKDVTAAKVEITPAADGFATVLYLFPRSMAIGAEEKRIEFAAQLGRLYVAQYFYPREMQLQGKQEL
jgi:hypothetical protein